MNIASVNKRSQKAIREALKHFDTMNGINGVYTSKNDEVVLNCFIVSTIGRIPEFAKTKEEVESWRAKLDPEDRSPITDHIKAGKALDYTLLCLVTGDDPDPEKILKLGGYMDEE